jgi:hypothetical protein
MDGLLFPILPTAQMSPSNYHLSGSVKDALRGRHFADDNELKQSFRDVLRSRGRDFTILLYGVLLNVGKSVLKMTQTS